MDFFKTAASSITKAVDFVVDKNRRAAMVNRLKIVIKSEKETQANAYIKLGKYYYENLREPENEETEPLCAAVERAGTRLKRAYAKLDELVVPAHNCCCDDSSCCSGEPAEDSADEPDAFVPEDTDGNGTGPDGESSDVDGTTETPSGEGEAADDESDYLHRFTVVPNDTEADGGSGDVTDPKE